MSLAVISIELQKQAPHHERLKIAGQASIDPGSIEENVGQLILTPAVGSLSCIRRKHCIVPL